MGDAAAVGTMGSSPLARGLRPPHRRDRKLPRIIPARAGFTASRASRVSYVRDHPRSRGVYAELGGGCEPGQGSSPLARGLRERPRQRLAQGRIIPARAGFTPARSAGRERPRDHPRSRGVYPSDGDARHAHMGSSPLARGLRVLAPHCTDAAGIIPARAGFTRTFVRCRGWVLDHPRSRGVYGAREGGFGRGFGSSPLARGLLR